MSSKNPNIPLSEVERLLKVFLADHAKVLISIITSNRGVDPRQIISEHTSDVIGALSLSVSKKLGITESKEDIEAKLASAKDLSIEEINSLLERLKTAKPKENAKHEERSGDNSSHDDTEDEVGDGDVSHTQKI